MRPRDNPFRVDRLHAVRFRPQTGSWLDLRARLTELNHRAAIVGPKGFGKTTLLEELRGQLADEGRTVAWLKLPDGSRRDMAKCALAFVDALTSESIAFIDSCEKLDWLTWRIVKQRSRRAAGLIVTAHQPGRLPTLITCTTSPALLREIVRELIGDASELIEPRLDELYTRHRGNIREALRALYDLCARDELAIAAAATPQPEAMPACR